jgi:hypothetical protein
MLPQTSRTYSIDSWQTDAELSAHGTRTLGRTQNFMRLFFCKFCQRMSLPSWSRLLNCIATTPIPATLIASISFWIFLSCLSLPSGGTSGAFPFSSGANKKVPIFTIHSTRGFGSWGDSAEDVHPLRDWFQMSWIDAVPISTKMVKNQSVRYGADQQDVRQTVCHHELAVTSVSARVAVGINPSVRRPTGIWFSEPLVFPQQTLKSQISHRNTVGYSQNMSTVYLFGDDLT